MASTTYRAAPSPSSSPPVHALRPRRHRPPPAGGGRSGAGVGLAPPFPRGHQARGRRPPRSCRLFVAWLSGCGSERPGRVTGWLQIVGQINNLFDRRLLHRFATRSVRLHRQRRLHRAPAPADRRRVPLRHSTFYGPVRRSGVSARFSFFDAWHCRGNTLRAGCYVLRAQHTCCATCSCPRSASPRGEADELTTCNMLSSNHEHAART